MENIAGFNVAISAILDVPTEDDSHPFITLAKFVFADDKPNANNQAVDYSEFENIKRSAIGMPVKIRYTGFDVGEHEGSIPIGVIRSMEEVTATDGSHQLIAEALLWREEYPEEVDYLKTSFAEGRAPGISYELGYADSETKSGVQFIKKVITLAATFVKHPAYGKRTRLLALAATVSIEQIVTEIQTVSENTGIPISQIIEALEDLTEDEEEDTPPPMMMGNSSEEGGNQMEEELVQARAEAASLSAEIESLRTQLEQKDAELAAAREETKNLQMAALIDTRTRRVVEAGLTLEADAEKAERKKALWASLTDEQFEEYLSDLVAAKQSATPAPVVSPALAAIARASAGNAVPRPEVKDTDFNSLKDAMKSIARPNSIE